MAVARQALSSPEQAVRLALENHPRVKAAALQVEAAEHSVRSAAAWPNPSVAFTPGLTRGGSDEELVVSQPLELNGARAARRGVAIARLRMVESEALREIRQVGFEAAAAFWNAVRAEGRRDLAESLAVLAAELERIASRQAELGSRPGIDATHSQLESARARREASLAASELEAALSELSAAVGGIAVADVEMPPSSGTVGLEPEAAVAAALAARPELAHLRAMADWHAAAAKALRAEGMPDLTPHYRMESVTRKPREGGFGVSITIPLLDYGSRKGRVREAEAEARAVEELRRAAEIQIRQEVLQALGRFRANERFLTEQQPGMLEASKKLVEAKTNGFRLGETTMVDVLEAQRTFRLVQSESIDARVDLGMARARLDFVMGAFPPTSLDGSRSKKGVKP